MLTVAEISDRCKVSRAVVYRWRKGILGGHVGYERPCQLPNPASHTDLLDFLARSDGHVSLRHEPPILKEARDRAARIEARERARTWYRRSA